MHQEAVNAVGGFGELGIVEIIGAYCHTVGKGCKTASSLPIGADDNCLSRGTNRFKVPFYH